MPSNILVGLGLLGVLLLPTRFGRAGRRLLVASVALIAAVGVLPIGAALTLPLEARFPRCDAAGSAPTGIVVLGGVIDPFISKGRSVVALSGAAERITVAVELAQRYPDAKLVFTGAAEGPFARRIFENLGVARSRILVERNAYNTAENALFAKQLVAPKQGERWLLITSAMHMPRAIGAFRKADFPVEACPVDYQTAGPAELWTPPGSLLAGVGKLDLAVHEWLGLAVYWATGRTDTLFPGPA
jgi:uncharacterized SAM-binding protein YcdF (DUF218 family)